MITDRGAVTIMLCHNLQGILNWYGASYIQITPSTGIGKVACAQLPAILCTGRNAHGLLSSYKSKQTVAETPNMSSFRCLCFQATYAHICCILHGS